MIFAAALTGPTGMGKTALSLSLADLFGAEILSLDSMQIYRGMDIGTAKATPAERARVPHHMLDICDPGEPFSASDYAEAALPVARDIAARGKLPLFVGGTGLYLSTCLRGGAPTPPPADPAYRREAEKTDAHTLYLRLSEVDPESAALCHENNVRRVIRALEIYDATGKTKSEWDEESRRFPRPLSLCHITLAVHDREHLYRRTDRRVDDMFDRGLEREVRGLVGTGTLTAESTAGQAIGYKEFFPYFAGACTLADVRENIRLSTRHYAKRQMTWFSHTENTYTLYVDTGDGESRGTDDLLREAAAVIDNSKTAYNHLQ